MNTRLSVSPSSAEMQYDKQAAQVQCVWLSCCRDEVTPDAVHSSQPTASSHHLCASLFGRCSFMHKISISSSYGRSMSLRLGCQDTWLPCSRICAIITAGSTHPGTPVSFVLSRMHSRMRKACVGPCNQLPCACWQKSLESPAQEIP
jgi:hypothetical protein